MTILNVKTIVSAFAALTLTAGLAAPALAMGSGDKYEDHQVGVGYTVYEPDNTANLKLTNFTARTDCPAGVDAPLIATYGKKSGARFTIEEGNPMCSDIGVGESVYRFKVDGKKAQIYAYCDPSVITNCTKDDVAKYGGHVTVVMPAGPGLSKTIVWIETWGGKKYLTWQQLVAVTKSLTPVA